VTAWLAVTLKRQHIASLGSLALLIACGSHALAASGLDSNCIEHSASCAVDRTDAAATAPLSATVTESALSSSETIDSFLTESPVETAQGTLTPIYTGTRDFLREIFGDDDLQGDFEIDTDSDPKPSDPPPTATRVPGIDSDDLPRFHRQMFRQDI
jgi:hypothetical protein